MGNRKVLVTGAGGFIGDHLVRYLKGHNYWVRAVDIKPPLRESIADQVDWSCDLRFGSAASDATQDIEEVYALAADHGGVGHISTHPGEVFWNNAMINLQTVSAAKANGVKRYFFSSSVCIYPRQLKTDPSSMSLRETDAFPAYPEHAYGWEKLLAEIVLPLFFGEESRIARFHTIYGPWCEWNGGREKVTPALARKVARAELTGDPRVEIWGDGEQTRTFFYIEDCVEMVHRLMRSDHHQPLNIGSDRLITIDELADMFAAIAGISIEKIYVPGPVGERYRGADLTEMRHVLGQEPQTPLEEGLARLYSWVGLQMATSMRRETG